MLHMSAIKPIASINRVFILKEVEKLGSFKACVALMGHAVKRTMRKIIVAIQKLKVCLKKLKKVSAFRFNFLIKKSL